MYILLINFYSQQTQYHGMLSQYDSLEEVMKPVGPKCLLNIDLRGCVSPWGHKPVGVGDAAVFIVDTSKLRHPDDLKADNMGSWINRYYDVTMKSSTPHLVWCMVPNTVHNQLIIQQFTDLQKFTTIIREH